MLACLVETVWLKIALEKGVAIWLANTTASYKESIGTAPYVHNSMQS